MKEQRAKSKEQRHGIGVGFGRLVSSTLVCTFSIGFLFNGNSTGVCASGTSVVGNQEDSSVGCKDARADAYLGGNPTSGEEKESASYEEKSENNLPANKQAANEKEKNSDKSLKKRGAKSSITSSVGFAGNLLPSNLLKVCVIAPPVGALSAFLNHTFWPKDEAKAEPEPKKETAQEDPENPKLPKPDGDTKDKPKSRSKANLVLKVVGFSVLGLILLPILIIIVAASIGGSMAVRKLLLSIKLKNAWFLFEALTAKFWFNWSLFSNKVYKNIPILYWYGNNCVPNSYFYITDAPENKGLYNKITDMTFDEFNNKINKALEQKIGKSKGDEQNAWKTCQNNWRNFKNKMREEEFARVQRIAETYLAFLGNSSKTAYEMKGKFSIVGKFNFWQLDENKDSYKYAENEMLSHFREDMEYSGSEALRAFGYIESCVCAAYANNKNDKNSTKLTYGMLLPYFTLLGDESEYVTMRFEKEIRVLDISDEALNESYYEESFINQLKEEKKKTSEKIKEKIEEKKKFSKKSNDYKNINGEINNLENTKIADTPSIVLKSVTQSFKDYVSIGEKNVYASLLRAHKYKGKYLVAFSFIKDGYAYSIMPKYSIKEGELKPTSYLLLNCHGRRHRVLSPKEFCDFFVNNDLNNLNDRDCFCRYTTGKNIKEHLDFYGDETNKDHKDHENNSNMSNQMTTQSQFNCN